jgi:hypothetical protein
MGMLKDAVRDVVAKIASDDIREIIKAEMDSKLNVQIANMFSEIIEAEKSKVSSKLEAKMRPLYVAIDAIDLSDAFEDKLEEIDKKVTEKIKDVISAIDSIVIDISKYNKTISTTLGDLLVEISEDDEDIEELLRKKLLENVGSIKFNNPN